MLASVHFTNSAEDPFYAPRDTLGVFFLRLMRKKNRNVAVVAAARKLARIAWLMLKNNEPYRYALPKSTETKLAKLRVKAAGKRRKSGTRKGAKRQALLPGGGRTIKSFAGLCASEGLPTPQPLSAGERRTVESAGCEALVAQLAEAQIVPRRQATGSSSLLPEVNHAGH